MPKTKSKLKEEVITKDGSILTITFNPDLVGNKWVVRLGYWGGITVNGPTREEALDEAADHLNQELKAETRRLTRQIQMIARAK